MQVQTVELVPGHGVNGSLDISDRLVGTGKIKHNASVGIVGRVLDGHGHLSRVEVVSGRVLVEELGEGFKSMQDTGRGLGTDVDLSIFRHGQAVRLINVSSARLEGGCGILSSLLDRNGLDSVQGSQLRLKVAVAGVQLPWHEVGVENGLEGSRDGALNNLLAVEVRTSGWVVADCDNLLPEC